MRLLSIAIALTMVSACGGDSRRKNGESCDQPAQCESGLCVQLVCVEPGVIGDSSGDVEVSADADATQPGDSGQPDADAVVADDGAAEVATPDADAAEDVAPDADAVVADLPTDTPETDTTGPTVLTCEPTTRDAVLFGTHPLTLVDGKFTWPSAPVTFFPGGPNAVVVPALEQENDRLHLFVARTTSAGLDWSAQVVAESPTQLINVMQARYSAAEDAVYVGFAAGRGDRTIRFYNADGTLFREFTPGGAVGSDLAGIDSQSNLFVARYNAGGAMAWVHRFGPNDPDGHRGASIENIQLVGDVLRVTGGISGPVVFPIDPGEVVFGAGQPDGLTLTTKDGFGYAVDFDRATGEYQADSLLTVDVKEQYAASLRGSQGYTNAAGERVIAGSHFGPDFGAVGYGATTLTATQPSAWVFKHTPPQSGWGRFITRVGSNTRHEPRGLALTEDGSVLLALYWNSSLTGLVDWQFDTDASPLTLQLEPDDAVLVRYSPAGAIDWTYRIDLNKLDNIPAGLVLDEATDTLFFTGNVSGKATFSRVDASPIVVNAGAYLAAFRLSTGTLLWVAPITGASSGVALGVPRVTATAIYLPARFSGLSVVGVGSQALQMPAATTAFGELVYDRDGEFVGCGAFSDQARGGWHTTAADE